MAFFKRLLGVDKQPGEREPAAPAPSGPRVSANRYWRCPNCGAVQRKAGLDTTYEPGGAIPEGLEPCSKCGARHPAVSVYGGSFDFTGESEPLSRGQAAQRYLDAEMAQNAAAVEALLAPDAVHSSMRGEVLGAKAIADRLRNPEGPGAGMMGRLQWSAPVETDGKVRFEGKPSMPNAPFRGLAMILSFDAANKITRIEIGRME